MRTILITLFEFVAAGEILMTLLQSAKQTVKKHTRVFGADNHTIIHSISLRLSLYETTGRYAEAAELKSSNEP